MFANNNLGVMNFGFPDVCSVITPAGPIPTPMPNIAMSSTHIPSVLNVIIGGGLAENLMTTGTVSNGDNAGLGMGVMSGMIMGPDRYIIGSLKVFMGVAPAAKLTSMTGQNGVSMNAPGVSLTPGQVKVLVLS
jgi:hypothetical protein